MKENPLFQTQNVRVRRYDAKNVIVEREETKFNKNKKEYVTRWMFHGYARTLKSALEMIVQKELIVNPAIVRSITTHLYAVQESNNKLLQEIRRMEESE